MITAGVLTNYTSLGIRRVDFNYCVRYGTDIAPAAGAPDGAAQKEDMVLQDPAPLFAVMNQGANGLEVSLRVYCKHENYWSVFFDMQEKIKASLNKMTSKCRSTRWTCISIRTVPLSRRQPNQKNKRLLPLPAGAIFSVLSCQLVYIMLDVVHKMCDRMHGFVRVETHLAAAADDREPSIESAARASMPIPTPLTNVIVF